MSRRAKPFPSHLAKVLAGLKANPRLEFSGLKSLKLSLAFQNDHFGARHFVKEHLPRIRYANPNLDIQVEKWRKTKEEVWRPEMELEFANGKHETIDMNEKWSTTILKELMEVAGGEPWAKWKLEALAAGIPVVPGEENEKVIVKRTTSTPLPTLKAFRAAGSPRSPVPPPADEPIAADSNPKAGVSVALP
ncbi:hypothetical protein H0H87_006913 [Tephrocybe sp. NHM501043]|nr:hypothetical protein H0H87_006913 [Tephrocybe sp. NHM501043]